MTTLAEYLIHKRQAFRTLRQRVLAPGYEPTAVHARATSSATISGPGRRSWRSVGSAVA